MLIGRHAYIAFLRFYTTIYAFIKGVRIGKGTIIHPGASVSRFHGGGTIAIGQYCEIHRGCLLWTYGGKISMGDHCTLNPYTVVYGHGGVEIANGVRIAAHTVLVSANHNFQDLDTPIFKQGLVMKGIKIAEDVWVGTGARVLDGVSIESGCVIAAGAVVNQSFPADSICGGVPAKLIGTRK